jgi:hypothetical protein
LTNVELRSKILYLHAKGGENGRMKNVLEGGRYLRGEEGGSAFQWLFALAGTAVLLYYADTAFQRGARTAMNEPDFPEGARQEFTQTARKFSVVYESQNEPKCPGDIKDVNPIINKAGELRGLKVVCNPPEVKPAQ